MKNDSILLVLKQIWETYYREWLIVYFSYICNQSSRHQQRDDTKRTDLLRMSTEKRLLYG